MSNPNRQSPLWRLALAVVLLLLSVTSPRPAAAQADQASCSDGYALWANGQGRDETLTISGSTSTITGKARSNADFRISGSNNTISGAVEYVTLFDDGGDANTYPSPSRVSATSAPVRYTLADYQPGGRLAEEALSEGRYTRVDGDLDVSEPRTLSGLYYVTGDAKLSASNITGTFTIVAAGAIDVSGSTIQATPYADGLLLFSGKREVGASVIKLGGSNSSLAGVIYGPGGTVELSGSDSTISGLIIGDALKLNGSDLRISFDSAHCPDAAPPAGEEPPRTGPPADFIIDDGAVRPRIEIINNITFVIIQITIKNTGGRSNGTFLWLDCGGGSSGDDDDDDGGGGRYDLSDVRFDQGTGYVRSWDGRQVVIGVGSNNVVHRNDVLVITISFRLLGGGDDDDDDDDRGPSSFAATSRLTFSDTSGSRQVALPPIQLPLDTPTTPQPTPQPTPAEVARLPLERIDPRFRAAWERGGLPIFGLPIGEPQTTDDGTVIQLFERARMEYGPGGVILLGRLAAELGYGRPGIDDDDLDDDDRRWYFSETGHVIAVPFRLYWTERGGLAIFGLPIAGLTSDEGGRQMQCFERACMQLFPEFSGTPSAIQLRLLGVELVTRDDDD